MLAWEAGRLGEDGGVGHGDGEEKATGKREAAGTGRRPAGSGRRPAGSGKRAVAPGTGKRPIVVHGELGCAQCVWVI